MTDKQAPTPAWHALAPDAVLAALNSAKHGLAHEEAARRLQHHGPNALPEAPRPGQFRRFLRQFHNPLIYVLIVAGAITSLLGDWLDSAVIFGVVLINALIGTLQEGKAERALAAIRAMLSPHATVLRAGERHEVDAKTLVPGDVVVLEPGDKVAADLRLLQARSLRIDESALTGESLPVDKQTDCAPATAALAERTSMAYAGTVVCYGQALGVIVQSAGDTELGRINRLLDEIGQGTTPLTRQLDRFARTLTLATLLVALATFAFGMLVRGESWQAMLMATVGLAVAAIPEGLPAIITITLAIGVERMAKCGAIMRKLPAVETLGAVTVICSDKTGTLTRNEMTAARVVTASDDYTVSGVGYAPDGGVFAHGQAVGWGENTVLDALLDCALLCNDARVREENGHWQLLGDPTEGALVTLALKAAYPAQTRTDEMARRDALPFESETRVMATLHRDHHGNARILVKGAPEAVLARAHRVLHPEGEQALPAAAWLARADALAAEGYRVLALAHKQPATDNDTLTSTDIEQGLTLLGLVGLIDPPRSEAAAAVAQCRQAGVRVKMITGDHATTAAAIGQALGLGNGRRALAGHEIDTLDDAALAQAVQETDVFARASPEHKLRLIAALKAGGEVVAMTGDGVNDAPALKRADVGVAMGGKGTEAAKEASAMVITDDNFATLARAVREGRSVYDNLKKAILFILPTNVGEAAIIVAAIAFGMPLPITPLQILWINMVTAITLALSLSFEPPEEDVMRRPPRAPTAGLIDALFVWRLGFVGALMVVLPFALYLHALSAGASMALASTVAVNTMVAIEIGYLFNSRYQHASSFTRATLTGNPVALGASGVLIALQLALTYLAPMQGLFGTAALTLADWGRITLAGLAAFALIELEKAWRRRTRTAA